MNKERELRKYSDPELVAERAMELGLNPVHPSSQARKKYMTFDGTRMVHFGQVGFSDWTKTRDPEQLRKFRARNRRWSNSPRYSPAWLAWNLLW